MEKYTVNIWSHLNHAKSIVIYLTLSFLLPILLINSYGYNDLEIFILMGCSMFLLYAFPLLVIHKNYCNSDCKKVLIFYSNIGKIEIKNPSFSTSFNIEDIRLVKRYMTASNRINFGHAVPWSRYNYSEIHLADGQKIIITSLLIQDFNFVSDKDKLFFRDTPYPIIKERKDKSMVSSMVDAVIDWFI